MWEEYLNIPTNLNIQEWGVYIDYLDACNESLETISACEYNTYRMGWVMDYGDAQNQLEVVFGVDSPFNYSATMFTGGEYRDRYNELLAQAGLETDDDARAEIYKELDRILVEEFVSHIPIYYYDRSIMIKNGIHFEFPPFGAPHFDKWYFE
jgi:ABC-type oligopeptide transport system substrate-binding subunit